MALAMLLGEAKLVPDSIHTTAEVTLDKTADGFEISAVHLTVRAKVPGADAPTFERIAEQAKQGCPVSKLLKGARIGMDAALEA
jgi:osmotically inducible protein OsmC